MLLAGSEDQDTLSDKVSKRAHHLMRTYSMRCLDVVSSPLNTSSTVQDAIPVKYSQKEFKEDIFLIDNTPEVAQQGLQVRTYTQTLIPLFSLSI